MEIKKTSRGYEYDGVAFDSLKVAERYRDALTAKQEKGDTAWLDEKIDFAFDPEKSNPSFKVFIDGLAKANDLTLSQVAERIGISRPTLYNWMDGRVLPDPASIDKLCKAFELSRQEVMLAAIDNFASAYPDIMGLIMLSMHDCQVILQTFKTAAADKDSVLGLQSTWDKIMNIRQVWENRKPTQKRKA